MSNDVTIKIFEDEDDFISNEEQIFENNNDDQIEILNDINSNNIFQITFKKIVITFAVGAVLLISCNSHTVNNNHQYQQDQSSSNFIQNINNHNQRTILSEFPIYVSYGDDTQSIDVPRDGNIGDLRRRISQSFPTLKSDDHFEITFGEDKLNDNQLMISDVGIGSESRLNIEVINYYDIVRSIFPLQSDADTILNGISKSEMLTEQHICNGLPSIFMCNQEDKVDFIDTPNSIHELDLQQLYRFESLIRLNIRYTHLNNLDLSPLIHCTKLLFFSN